ncbi:hypothetical protein [Vibrio parahaemolyticus]|uniref:hypothetical protein n=1 Tax=Vibrio parahaemolyticus TaxID=670 RepID=UPI00215333C7|nr:hypothetical protein [Vibrio parahaemolyticus]
MRDSLRTKVIEVCTKKIKQKGSGNWLCFTMTVLETGEKIGSLAFTLLMVLQTLGI